MKSYAIYLNYDPTTLPIGRVEIDETQIPEDIFPDIAIVPMHIKTPADKQYHIAEFGLIHRTNVDTRHRDEFGQA